MAEINLSSLSSAIYMALQSSQIEDQHTVGHGQPVKQDSEIKLAVSESCPKDKKLSKYLVKKENCLSSFLTWDYFSPPPTDSLVYMLPGQRGNPPANGSRTLLLEAPSHPTLRLKLPEQAIPVLPEWSDFRTNLNDALAKLRQQLPKNTDGQDTLSTAYQRINQFVLLHSSGEITQDDVSQLNELIKNNDLIWLNNPKIRAASVLRNLSDVLRGVCFSRKCYEHLKIPLPITSSRRRYERLMTELVQLDPNNQILTKWRDAIRAKQEQLQSEQLHQSMSDLRLTQRPEVPPASTPHGSITPQGAAGGTDDPNRPSREALIQETQSLVAARVIVANSLSKIDRSTPSGQKKYARIKIEHQRLNDQIEQKNDTYHRHYGHAIKHQLQQWFNSATQMLAAEESATTSELQQLQTQMEPAIKEIELFFGKGTHLSYQLTWNQLTDALNRTKSGDDFLRVRGMIESDQTIMPNQLRPGDDLPLHYLFRERSQELDSQIAILKMPELSDDDKEQVKANIAKITKELDSIADLFSNVIHRYKRLESADQYPHQLADIREAVSKGRRVIATELSQKTQERLRLIETMENPSINIDHLLDMSDEDFQLILTLTNGKPLTEEQKKIMANNGWQLSENDNLVTQSGHDRVTVVSIGSMYRLIDTATHTPIGTLDRIRWERIHKRLESQGRRGTNNITRQMIIDDFREFPTTEAQWQAQRAERLGGFPDSLRQQGEVVVTPPSSNEPPEGEYEQSGASNVLRYGRRYFREQP